MFQGLKLRINSCGISDCGASWSWDTSSRGFNDYDLWAVFRGAGELEVGDRSYAIESGMCFLLPPNTHVKGRHNPSNPILTVNIHFSFIENGRGVFPFQVQRRYVSNQAFFHELLERAVSTYYRGDEESAERWLEVSLDEFFASADCLDETPSAVVHNRIVQEICAEINGAVASAPSLAEFAQKYGYSATYLGKMFHRIAKVGFAEYLLSARINQAKIMLKTTERSVNEIASELGFCDTCFFVKQFKKYVGLPPGAYRKA